MNIYKKGKIISVKGNGSSKKNARILYNYAASLVRIFQSCNIEAPNVITEEQYKNSIWSNESDDRIRNLVTRCIFIGEGKTTKNQLYSVMIHCNKFGISYGWLGNKCVIYIDAHSIKRDSLSEFINTYNSMCKKVDELYLSNQKKQSEKLASDQIPIRSVKMAAINELHQKFNPISSDTKKIKAEELFDKLCQMAICDFFLRGFIKFITSVNTENKSENRILVVYNDSEYKYAQLLENSIVAYSNYNAILVSEKVFNSNAFNISSDNRIIFLGETETSKNYTLYIKTSFQNFNSKYGYQGPHAFMLFDKKAKMSLFHQAVSLMTSYSSIRGKYGELQAKGFKNTDRWYSDENTSHEDNMYRYLIIEFILNDLDKFVEMK